jgi:hypothetical protein
MREGNRAERRFHIGRLKKKRKHYWGFPNRWSLAIGEPPQEMNEKQLGKVVQYPQACSCACCCNVRRATNMSDGGERTMQERRFFANYEEQLVEE